MICLLLYLDSVVVFSMQLYEYVIVKYYLLQGSIFQYVVFYILKMSIISCRSIYMQFRVKDINWYMVRIEVIEVYLLIFIQKYRVCIDYVLGVFNR